MKSVLCFLLLSALGWPDAGAAPASRPGPTPVPAREVLSKTIEPLVDVFARSPDGANRAFTLRVRVAESNIHPPELIGQTLVVRAVAAPANKIFFQYASLGTVITFCRQGQTVWAAPAARLAPLLEKVKAAKLTKSDQEPLAALRLPIPTTVFWALFRFASVRDAGSQTLEGVPCRLLDVDPDDEDKDSKGKFLRLWIRPETGQLARIESRDHGDHTTYTVEETRYSPTLPESDFQPTAAQRADMLEVPVERFRPLMKLIGEEEKRRRKEQKEHPPTVEPAAPAASNPR